METLFGMWDVMSVLIVLGLMIGIVLAVTIGAIRIGWNLAPWIVIGAFIVWFLSWAPALIAIRRRTSLRQLVQPVTERLVTCYKQALAS